MPDTNIIDPQKRKPVIVCRVCGLGPADGAALFSNMVGGERRRFCAEHMPLDRVRQRLEAQRGPALDADVVATFTRRLSEAEQ